MGIGCLCCLVFYFKKKTNTDQVIKNPVMPPIQAPETPFDPLFGSPITTSVNSVDANYTAKFVLNGYRSLGKMPNTI